MSRLLFDIGNTRLKYLKTGATIKQGFLELNDYSQLQQLCSGVSYIFVSFVGDIQRLQKIEAIMRVSCARVEFISSVQVSRYFNSSYENPDRMGVDRWLAINAAYDPAYRGTTIVVDAGTAMTIDVIKGRDHKGGFITPGFYLQYKSLIGHAALPENSFLTPSLELGSDTQSCMQNGIWTNLVAIIERANTNDQDAKLIISGGDGYYLNKLIDKESIYVENIVLDGLLKYVEDL